MLRWFSSAFMMDDMDSRSETNSVILFCGCQPSSERPSPSPMKLSVFTILSWIERDSRHNQIYKRREERTSCISIFSWRGKVRSQKRHASRRFTKKKKRKMQNRRGRRTRQDSHRQATSIIPAATVRESPMLDTVFLTVRLDSASQTLLTGGFGIQTGLYAELWFFCRFLPLIRLEAELLPHEVIRKTSPFLSEGNGLWVSRDCHVIPNTHETVRACSWKDGGEMHPHTLENSGKCLRVLIGLETLSHEDFGKEP